MIFRNKRKVLNIDSFETEPPRVFRRLHFFRGWSDDQKNEIFPGSTGTSGTAGI
jgi:hypothetical protein